MCIFESMSEARYKICTAVGRKETFWKKFASMFLQIQSVIREQFYKSFKQNIQCVRKSLLCRVYFVLTMVGQEKTFQNVSFQKPGKRYLMTGFCKCSKCFL